MQQWPSAFLFAIIAFTSSTGYGGLRDDLKRLFMAESPDLAEEYIEGLLSAGIGWKEIAVWIGGFSDGASASFSHAMFDPTNYLNQHLRDSFPPKIVWKATDRRFGRCSWLSF